MKAPQWRRLMARLTPDEYLALVRLEGVPRGIAKALIDARHGFAHEVIAGLCRPRLQL
jgi:hypothetical protein